MPEHRHDHEPEPVIPRDERRGRGRRVRTQPPDGSDPSPVGEPPRHRADENDDRLRRDVPPHYGG